MKRFDQIGKARKDFDQIGKTLKRFDQILRPSALSKSAQTITIQQHDSATLAAILHGH